MSNGDVFRVSHPDVALLLKTKIVIGDPDNDRSWTCALLHINAIETQQAA
jgi:hypothetical protein